MYLKICLAISTLLIGSGVLDPKSIGAHAGFISVTTPLGYRYLLSDYEASSFSTASTACAGIGSTMVAYPDNARYQDMVDYLRANAPTYDSFEIWVPVTKTSSPTAYYFTGADEVAGDKWYPGEPNRNCRSSCCYRMTKYIDLSVDEHLLGDNYCSNNYYFVCEDNTVTTTTTSLTTPTTTPATPTTTPTTPTTTPTTPTTTATAPATTPTTPTTTATGPTTTPTMPTTTATGPTTTPTTPTTTATGPTTTPTTPTTTATGPTTTPTAPITTATAPTTTLTVPTTTPTTPPASPVPITTAATGGITTVTTISVMTTTAPTLTTPTPGSTVEATTVQAVALSTGQQMTILYIGIIIGGSIGLSCCCSLMWLGINRTRRSYRAKQPNDDSAERDEEKGDASSESASDEEE